MRKKPKKGRPTKELRARYLLGVKVDIRDGDYLFPGSTLTAEQVEFGRAMEQYKHDARRPYPNWLEVLNVAKDLGYRKETD